MNLQKITGNLIILILIITACNKKDNSNNNNQPLYKNADKSIQKRVEDLLSRMTLEEKIAQVSGTALWKYRDYENHKIDYDSAKKYLNKGIGQIQQVDLPVDSQVKYYNAFQKFLIEESRLGIPAIFHHEFLHGLKASDATSFPQAIGLGSTWNPELIKQIFSAAALEGRSRGIQQGLSPVVDVARDPRWGRTQECYSEDPYLVAEMGKAFVRGLQGQSSKMISKEKVIATLKHFSAYSQPFGAQNMGPANYSERYLLNVFHKPFKKCIQEAEALSVMASYNEINGIPVHASSSILTDLLRNKWGFNGTVVSDYSGVERLKKLHYVAETKRKAAKLALKAGVDIDLPGGDCFEKLDSLISNNQLKEKYLDSAVARHLRLKFRLGLFEDPYVEKGKAKKVTGCKKHQELALKAARESMVLLKNENNILPLKTNDYKNIAVIGPMAKRCHRGTYFSKPKHCVSLLQGIKERVKNKASVEYSIGCQITKEIDSLSDYEYFKRQDYKFPAKKENERDISEAVSLAKKNDLVILAVGANELVSRESFKPEREGDRQSLKLPGAQQKLFMKLKKTGTPVVVVLINGIPLSVNKVKKEANAILEAWFPAQEGGHAIADVLFGDYNPSGKLTITFPKDVGRLPSFYNKKPSRNRGYVENNDLSPLYPFGYGLSYTSYEYSPPKLSKSSIDKSDSVEVSVKIKNTGDRAGHEIAQLYIRDIYSSVTRPVKELKGFKKVHLKPGEEKEVKFTLTPEKLGFYNKEMKYEVEPGKFRIMTGKSSVDYQETTLNVTDVK